MRQNIQSSPKVNPGKTKNILILFGLPNFISMAKKSVKSKKTSKAKKAKSGKMPTEAQIRSAAKELEKKPFGTILVRHGFMFACTRDGHISFQKK